MFMHMEEVRTAFHIARNTKYELAVYRVIETGEVRVYISKAGQGLEIIGSAGAEVVGDAARHGHDVSDLAEALIQAAIDEIERNDEDRY